MSTTLEGALKDCWGPNIHNIEKGKIWGNMGKDFGKILMIEAGALGWVGGEWKTSLGQNFSYTICEK